MVSEFLISFDEDRCKRLGYIRRQQINGGEESTMAWNVSLYKFSQRYDSVSEIASDEQLGSLGSLAVVRETVTSVFAGTDWSDPHWGIFSSEIGSIEFNIGKEDDVRGVALHVRADDAIVDGILLLCERLACQAIDLSDGSFLEQSDNPSRNLQKWREYRDQIVGHRG